MGVLLLIDIVMRLLVTSLRGGSLQLNGAHSLSASANFFPPFEPRCSASRAGCRLGYEVSIFSSLSSNDACIA